MSKWRPSPKDCLYVIGDVHGQLSNLKQIFKRILPLRKSDGGKDRLIMLGDYIDRSPEAPLVVDLLIETKKKYKDQIILLKGNHEKMLLDALKPSQQSFNYTFWMKNGGEQTLAGYLKRIGAESEVIDNPYLLPRYRLPDFVPAKHVEFFKSLESFYETDDYIFVHGGCDPSTPLNKQEEDSLVWDRKLFETVIGFIRRKSLPQWEKTIITGHNGNADGQVLITNKFMMIDCSYAKKIMAIELNSMEAFIAQKNKKRLVKEQLNDHLPLYFP
jgi:serine/threonine protein phosphatase 1